MQNDIRTRQDVQGYIRYGNLQSNLHCDAQFCHCSGTKQTHNYLPHHGCATAMAYQNIKVSEASKGQENISEITFKDEQCNEPESSGATLGESAWHEKDIARQHSVDTQWYTVGDRPLLMHGEQWAEEGDQEHQPSLNHTKQGVHSCGTHPPFGKACQNRFCV